MQTITFTCEVITPMFLAGADGTTPELRPASIKGALRFWWRAMNGHLEWKKMLELEGKIFGNTQQRSSLIIRIEQDLGKTSKESLLPHKGGSLTPCFPKSDESFIVKFSLTKIENDFNLESIKALFILTSILGGLGKRSRRGFGSFRITNINNQAYSEEQKLENLLPFMNVLVVKNSANEDKFKIDRNRIILNSKSLYRDLGEFPYVTEIHIGTQVKTVSEIGNSTHKVMSSDSFLYKSTVGAGKPRFASPIYISMLKENLPIITTLKTVSQGGKKWSLQTDLKNEIL